MLSSKDYIVLKTNYCPKKIIFSLKQNIALKRICCLLNKLLLEDYILDYIKGLQTIVNKS